mgnify:CR=1 FL=1
MASTPFCFYNHCLSLQKKITHLSNNQLLEKAESRSFHFSACSQSNDATFIILKLWCLVNSLLALSALPWTSLYKFVLSLVNASVEHPEFPNCSSLSISMHEVVEFQSLEMTCSHSETSFSQCLSSSSLFFSSDFLFFNSSSFFFSLFEYMLSHYSPFLISLNRKSMNLWWPNTSLTVGRWSGLTWMSIEINFWSSSENLFGMRLNFP